MKITAIAVALIAALSGCAVATEAQNPPIVLTEVHELPGQTKAQICTKARNWAATRMVGQRQAVEVFDVDGGQLIARGQAPIYSMAGPVLVDFAVRMECREGRARSVIESLTAWHQGAAISLAPNRILMIRENAEPKLREIAADLSAALKAKGQPTDW